MPVEQQTVAGAGQFDGTAGNGLFNWDALVTIGQFQRIRVNRIAYSGAAGDAISDLRFLYVEPGGGATDLMLVGHAVTAALVNPATTQTFFTVCDSIVPKVSSTNVPWVLQIHSTGKSQTATVTVDWGLAWGAAL